MRVILNSRLSPRTTRLMTFGSMMDLGTSLGTSAVGGSGGGGVEATFLGGAVFLTGALLVAGAVLLADMVNTVLLYELEMVGPFDVGRHGGFTVVAVLVDPPSSVLAHTPSV